MKVNGKACSLKEPVTLLAFLQQLGCDPAKVAVERNGGIVPKAQFGSVMLCDTDELEVVSFVGGG